MSKDTAQESTPVEPVEETSRRDVLLGVISVGAGAAVVSGCATEAGVQTAKREPLYDLAFGEPPTLPQLQASLKEILRIAGCVNCGLNGFDIRLELRPDVTNLNNFKGIEGGGHYRFSRG